MKTIREQLFEADPLRHEPVPSSGQLASRRQAVIAAASSARVGSRSKLLVFATIAATAIGVSVLNSHGVLQAAVRFEVRLAEDRPAPGLREVKAPGSGRPLYLHEEVVVSNSDIGSARVVSDSSTERFSVEVHFNARGAEKMRAATAGHIGKPVAILLDGQVVLTPIVRASISESAMITGDFTKAEAERIAKGIR